MNNFDLNIHKKLIGERIKAVRNSQRTKISQSEFGKKIFEENSQDPKSQISKIETGQVLPTVNSLISLSEAYGASIDYILFGTTRKIIKKLCNALADPIIGREFAEDCEKKAEEICPYFAVGSEENDDDSDEKYLGYVDSDDPNNPSQYSLRIKKLFKKRGLKQIEIAEELGVRKSTVSEWFKNAGLPSLKVLCSLHKRYRFSVDYILLGTLMPYRNPLYRYFRESNYDIQVKFLKECLKILKKYR